MSDLEPNDLDGTQIVRPRLRPLTLLGLFWIAMLVASGGDIALSDDTLALFAVLIPGFVVAVLISPELRAGLVRGIRGAARSSGACRRTVRGRARVRRAVPHPRTGELVGAYCFAVASPTASAWHDLLWSLAPYFQIMRPAEDALYAGIGEVEVMLGSGEVARIATRAFEPWSWRRKRRAALDFVLRDGEDVEVRGLFEPASAQDTCGRFIAAGTDRVRMRVLRG